MSQLAKYCVKNNLAILMYSFVHCVCSIIFALSFIYLDHFQPLTNYGEVYKQ